MMRRLRIALAVLVAIVVVGVLLLVVNLNRLVEANRERIVAGMSAGFARPVQVDGISTGFRGGIAITLDGIHVAEDPAFGTGDFAAADRAYVVVRLRPLLRGRIEIRRIVVHAPRVTIVRTATGLSIDSLGRRPEAPPGPSAPPPASSKAPSAPASIPALAVALLELEDGVVRYVDRTKATPVETTIEPLDLHVSDLSLTDAVHVELDATATGATPTTVRVRGTLGPIGDPPFAGDVPIEQHVAIHGAGVDVTGLAVTGRVRRSERGTPIASVRIAAPALRAGGVDLAGLDVTASEQDRVATLERMAFQVFGGTVEASGRVDHSGATPAFSAETRIRGVDVSQALAARQSDLATRFHGRLEADCSVSGSAGDDAVVRRTLEAKGHAAVRDGVLEGVNVADGVLSGVTGGVGGLVTLVPKGVRERYGDLFSSDDTRFDELASELRVADQRIVLESLAVSARDWAVRGKGTVTFAQHVDIAATLVASKRLTADIAGTLREVKLLTDDDGLLAIPFRLVGVLPHVRPQPDKDFAGRLLRNALSGESLEHLLGGKPGKDGHGAGDGLKRQLEKLFR